ELKQVLRSAEWNRVGKTAEWKISGQGDVDIGEARGGVEQEKARNDWLGSERLKRGNPIVDHLELSHPFRRPVVRHARQEILIGGIVAGVESCKGAGRYRTQEIILIEPGVAAVDLGFGALVPVYTADGLPGVLRNPGSDIGRHRKDRLAEYRE